MKFLSSDNERIHLDFASTTPVRKEVFDVMKPYFSGKWANASAIYREGVKVREEIEKERERLARTLRVRAGDIVFTSGGTESNNLGLRGYFAHLNKEGVPYSEMEVISTKIEHPSVLETLKHLEGHGITVSYAPVDEDGKIVLSEFQKLLSKKTRLVAFSYVNSEIGTVQDVKKITHTIRKWNDKHKTEVRTLLDACQAPLWLPCELDSLGVDMLTLDAGKCYGPKGVGVLVKRHWIELEPIIFGGGQEGGLRPGTENTALIIGCVEAMVRAQENWEERSESVSKIRDAYTVTILKEVDTAVLNGSSENRVANNINFSIPGIDGEYTVITLDAKGVSASTRSACGAGKGAGSHVVREITGDEARALSTIRLTLGEESLEKDVHKVVKILKDHLKLMKQ